MDLNFEFEHILSSENVGVNAEKVNLFECNKNAAWGLAFVRAYLRAMPPKQFGLKGFYRTRFV